MGHVDPGVTAPASDHTFFVIGVAPQNMRIAVFRGDVSDGAFHQNAIAAASYLGTPEDGFILGETHGGNTMAITFVVPLSSPNDVFSTPLVPCNGAKTLVFDAPAGKVIYAGSVRYTSGRKGLLPSYGDDLEGARAFLKQHYPALAAGLEAGHPKLLPINQACG